MGSFSDSFAKFDKALEDVKAKKAAMDTAKAALDVAASEYTKSVDEASALRSQIAQSIGSVLPTSDERVRISG